MLSLMLSLQSLLEAQEEQNVEAFTEAVSKILKSTLKFINQQYLQGYARVCRGWGYGLDSGVLCRSSETQISIIVHLGI